MASAISKTSRAILTNGHIINDIFKIEEKLGSGTYGDCYKSQNVHTKEKMALKFIKNEPKYRKQAEMEIRILHTLKMADPEVISSFVVYKYNFWYESHVVLVFELLGKNLFELIKDNKYEGFSNHDTKKACKQILNCLVLLDKLDIIHADLKPENIVKDPRTNSLKVIDFGSSFFQEKRCRYPIQSSYYRAPEVIIGMSATTSIDMWSLGCILFELDTGLPLFNSNDERDIIMMQMSIVGCPTKDMLSASHKHIKKYYYINDIFKFKYDTHGREHPVKGVLLKDKCVSKDPLFIQFIMMCLNIDPTKRMTPQQAFCHPWIEDDIEDDIKGAPIELDCIDEPMDDGDSKRAKRIKLDNINP